MVILEMFTIFQKKTRKYCQPVKVTKTNLFIQKRPIHKRLTLFVVVLLFLGKLPAQVNEWKPASEPHPQKGFENPRGAHSSGVGRPVY